MSSDVALTDLDVRSLRADVAMLTLQLRALERDATAAEAALVVDDGAILQLRERLAALLDERRRALADDFERARAESEAAVADARTRADAMVAQAEAEQRARAERAVSPLPPPTIELDDVTLTWAEALPGDEHAGDVDEPEREPDDEPEPEFIDAEPEPSAAPAALVDDVSRRIVETTELGETGETTEARIELRPPPLPLPAPTSPAPVTVVLDAEAFARAFAIAYAAATEHRPQAAAPVAVPPRRTSFWAHAWHADVLLSFVAMAIVLIVLAAWTG